MSSQPVERLRRSKPQGGSGDDVGLEKKALLAALTRFKRGDFSVRLPSDETGVDGKIADTFNEVVELNERMAAELDG